jgi:hypothetical protein
MLKKITEAFFFGNFWISAGAGVLSAGISNLLFQETHTVFALFVATATFFVYSFQRLIRWDTLSDGERNIWLQNSKKALVVFSVLSFIILILLAFTFNLKLWFFFIGLGVLSITYVPLRFLKLNSGLREIPFLKIFLIAFVWAAVLVCGNVLFSNEIWLFVYSILTSVLFLYIFLLTIPFDVRDLEFDGKTLRSLPFVLGEKSTKGLSVLLSLIVGSIHTYLFHESFYSTTVFVGQLICTLVACASVFYSYKKPKPSDWFCSAFVDGLVFFSGLLYLLG